MTIVSLVFTAAGAGLLLAAGQRGRRRMNFVSRSAVAPGKIVSLREDRGGEGICFFPRVKFTTALGQEVTFESEMGSGAYDGKVGAPVRVRYQVDRPHVAEIDRFIALWGATLAFGFMGAVALFVGIGLLSGWLPA